MSGEKAHIGFLGADVPIKTMADLNREFLEKLEKSHPLLTKRMAEQKAKRAEKIK